MWSNAERVAVKSLVQSRVLSTSSLARCYDPKIIRVEGFNPIAENAGSAKDASSAFAAASMFVKQKGSQGGRCTGSEVQKNDIRENWQFSMQKEWNKPKHL
ncbi:hypothetical protein OESDEN_07163 [Oesophagostomum dentatum]|uniref:Uncharacterized protein n=1 Tax=Oesophagostomum dentatum TaxID=61180 RepID=A0A0B1T9V1_OESDE|nr:hypothetical protein OESDEN_07163 [Oesophagostomum dentatum]